MPDKEKKGGSKTTTRITKGNWKRESPTLERRDVNIRKATPGSKGSMFDEAFGKARKAGKTEFEWEGKPYKTNLAKPEYRTVKRPAEKPEKTPPMEPMPTRSTPLPKIESGRKVISKMKKRPATAIYTKRERKPDRNTKQMGTGAKGGKFKKKAEYLYKKLSPIHSASKQGDRMSVGRKTFQTTTRPVSEKDAYKPGLTRSGKQKLMPGVKKANLGSEKGEGSSKRTNSGVATENTMATNKERREGKKVNKARKEGDKLTIKRFTPSKYK